MKGKLLWTVTKHMNQVNMLYVHLAALNVDIFKSLEFSLLFLCCGSGSGSRSRRAKKTHEDRKMLINFIFWSAGCSILKDEGFACSLDIL
jgi:hypothetical protein